MIDTIINILQIVFSLLIVLLIIVQGKSSGLSTMFGGGSFQTTRRGSEKFLHNLTIILVILFSSLSLARVFI